MSKFNLLEIQDPSFLKKLSINDLEILASEIRKFLIASISKTGGHLSSNLGVVELTIALHYVFDSPRDKIFFDVGHQAYTHKILTGRAEQFSTLRQFKGLSGFQKRNESVHDVWEAGHSSTALSAAVGMAFARDLNHDNYHILPVIGDAAMVGGPSLEALNHLGSSKTKVIIILNDNEMSISKNVGGISEFLSEIRTSEAYNHAKDEYRQVLSHTSAGKQFYSFSSRMKNMLKRHVIDAKMFGEFGVDYLGPIDGHNIAELIRALFKAKSMKNSVVIHVKTKKGKGYPYAENDTKGTWHGVEPFNIRSGKPLNQATGISWSSYISEVIYDIMKNNNDVVAITPAMISGSKLEKVFKDLPERSFDVGIAEEHAATFAAGLAIAGKKPYITMYSSFLQRAYDQINHDIARMNLPVVIGVDRAGLVGADGETHHGVFDLGLIKPIPNTEIFVPHCTQDARWYLENAFKFNNGVRVIRYSKGMAISDPSFIKPEYIGAWQQMTDKRADTVFITYGQNVQTAIQFLEENDLLIDVINARFLKPIDYKMLSQLFETRKKIIVYETDQKSCGLAKDILEYANEIGVGCNLLSFGFGNHFISQGTITELLHQEHMCLEDIKEDMEKFVNEKGTC